MWQRTMDARQSDECAPLRESFADYRRRWPNETAVVDAFLVLLDIAEDPFVRERWLQLGGHADGDRNLTRAALKEAEEESGLTGLSVDRELFDLDRHWIPEHKGVPAHWHYDVRYVVSAGDSEEFVVSDESHDLAWRGIATLVEDEDADLSLRRMAKKWLARGIL